MGNIIRREIKLAKRLKELCADDGKEINLTESANILNALGLLYKEKSPDKISIIQSAAFLNAAIIRQPFNKEFKNDLDGLCFHVLEVAKAKQSKADLVDITKEALKMIKEMRYHANESLDKLETIPIGLPDKEIKRLKKDHINRMRKLQEEITERYISLMDNIAKNSIEVMGSPPCRYSITAMGSLARKEITPFSDLEHIILLEEGVQHKQNYQEILEYFRWVSVIFHIIIINLKETIVRSVAVPWMNDDSITGGDWFFDAHTPCGIKFDGMQLPACKIPLGRTRETDNKPFKVELIKPISEMTKYLEIEEDIKNGYHLADVLTKTCFVSGDKDVHEDFQELAKNLLSGEETWFRGLIKEDIKKYFKDFHTLTNFDIYKRRTSNIKSFLYRSSTLFISALGRLHSIDRYSCFEIIDELFEKHIICNEMKQKFLYMISISCAVRLKFYRSKNGQDDFFHNLVMKIESGKHGFTLLSDFVDEQMLADYLLITSTLQAIIKKEEPIPWVWNKLKMAPHLKFDVLKPCLLHDRILVEWKKYLESGVREEPDKDHVIRTHVADSLCKKHMFKESLQIHKDLSREPGLKLEKTIDVVLGTCACLKGLERYREVIDYVPEAKKLIQSFSFKWSSLPILKDQVYRVFLVLLFAEGECKRNLKMYDDAITSYHEAINYYNVESPSGEIALCYSQIGLCETEVGRPRNAITVLCVAIVLLLKDKAKNRYMTDVVADTSISLYYSDIGKSYELLNEFSAANKYYKSALDIWNRIPNTRNF